MSKSPDLKRLAEKYSSRLDTDPLFRQRVKAIYRTFHGVDAQKDDQTLKVTAYLLACALEETHEPGL